MNTNFNNQKVEEIINILRFYLHEISHISLILRLNYAELLNIGQLETKTKNNMDKEINSNLENLSSLTDELHLFLKIYDTHTNFNTEDIQLDDSYLKRLISIFDYDLLLKNKRINIYNLSHKNETIVINTCKKLFEVALQMIIRIACNCSYSGTKINIETKKLDNNRFIFKTVCYGYAINSNIDTVSNIFTTNNNYNLIDDFRLNLLKTTMELLDAKFVYYSEKLSDFYVPFSQKWVDFESLKKTTVESSIEIYNEIENENKLESIITFSTSDDVKKAQVLSKKYGPMYKTIFEVTL